MLPVIVAIFLALSVVGGGVVYASETAPPTSPLHSVQIVVNGAASSLHVGLSSTATSTPVPTPVLKGTTDHPSGSNARDDARPNATLTPLPSPVASAVATLEAGVKMLATDTAVPGSNGHGPEDGLAAKLDAAVAAMERGDTQTASNILDAFAHELNAMRQSGHISDADYTSLYAQYTALLTLENANATPVPSVTPHARGPEAGAAHQNQRKDDDEMTATPTPATGATLSATPTPEPHGRGNTGRGHAPTQSR